MLLSPSSNFSSTLAQAVFVLYHLTYPAESQSRMALNPVWIQRANTYGITFVLLDLCGWNWPKLAILPWSWSHIGIFGKLKYLGVLEWCWIFHIAECFRCTSKILFHSTPGFQVCSQQLKLPCWVQWCEPGRVDQGSTQRPCAHQTTKVPRLCCKQLHFCLRRWLLMKLRKSHGDSTAEMNASKASYKSYGYGNGS